LKAVDLGSANSKWGLPTFTNAVLSTFLYDRLCLGDSTEFTLTGGSTVIDSVFWDFGEPGSGSSNYSRKLEPKHRYMTQGEYTVELILYHSEKSDTISKTLTVLPGPDFDLGNDTTLCKGESLYLVVPSDTADYEYLWHDQSTDSTYTVSGAEKVWLSVSNGTCLRSDTVNVFYDFMPKPSLGNDTSLCSGESLTLSGDPGASYEWQNGSPTQEQTVSTSGLFWLKQSRNGCSASDTIEVLFLPKPTLDLGPDTFLCDSDPGFQVTVTPEPDVSYVWDDGSTELTRMFSKAGKYFISAKNADCEASDTLDIKHYITPYVDLGPDSDSAFCIGLKVRLEVPVPDAQFLWQDNSTRPFFEVEEEGRYWVNASNPCGTSSDTIVVEFKPCYCNLKVPNAFSPNVDDLNDRFKPLIECPTIEYHFAVYNRWGQRIFETVTYGEAWDGTYLQKDCPNGIYFYTLELVSIGRKRINQGGMIQLIR
jgi:gliding motility-associated-like protein